MMGKDQDIGLLVMGEASRRFSRPTASMSPVSNTLGFDRWRMRATTDMELAVSLRPLRSVPPGPAIATAGLGYSISIWTSPRENS